MAAVTVASAIVLFFLPLGVIGKAVGVGQPVTDAVKQPHQLGYWYMQFVLQVPRTVNRYSNVDQPFTIHGLWPSNYRNTKVAYCHKRNLTTVEVSTKLHKIDGLINELSGSWPNVYSYSPPTTEFEHNLQFWTDEYNKHGSCAPRTFRTPEAFFRIAVGLYRSNHIQDLKNKFAGIRNSIPQGQRFHVGSWSYYMQTVESATAGNLPRLWCKKDRQGRILKELKEVVICYDTLASGVIPCPRDIGPNCFQKKPIYYPK